MNKVVSVFCSPLSGALTVNFASGGVPAYRRRVLPQDGGMFVSQRRFGAAVRRDVGDGSFFAFYAPDLRVHTESAITAFLQSPADGSRRRAV